MNAEKKAYIQKERADRELEIQRALLQERQKLEQDITAHEQKIAEDSKFAVQYEINKMKAKMAEELAAAQKESISKALTANHECDLAQQRGKLAEEQAAEAQRQYEAAQQE